MGKTEVDWDLLRDEKLDMKAEAAEERAKEAGDVEYD